MRTTPLFFLFTLVACSGEEFTPQEPAQPQAGAAGQTSAGQSGASSGGAAGQGGAAGTQGGLSGSAGTSQGGVAGQTSGSGGEQPGGQGGTTAGASGVGGAAGNGGSGAPLCEPGKTKCDGADLLLCKDPMKGFEFTVTCDSAAQCSEKYNKCLSCVPGSTLSCLNPTVRAVCTEDGKTNGVLACPDNLPRCDNGECRECTADVHCKESNTQCIQIRCQNFQCIQDIKAGQPTADQTPGDCKQTICSTEGMPEEATDPNDLPPSNNKCTIGTCNGNTPATEFAAPGTSCGTGGEVCNDAGVCLGCTPGTTRCATNDKALETCQPNGTWQASPCPLASPICSQDACIGIKQISLGDEHSCALFEDGQVRCWGSNAAGQIGNGKSESPVKTPAVVVELPPVEQIAAGARHTCARTADGAVYCWGENVRGQLGNNKGAIQNKPSLVNGLPAATNIEAGGQNTCSIHDEGKTYCWGDNQYGQMYPTNPQFNAPNLGPFPSKKLAVGGSFICAIEFDDKVRCKGNNKTSQLGVTNESSNENKIQSLLAVDIYSGKNHSCAHESSGTLYCWGDNLNAKLGSVFLQGGNYWVAKDLSKGVAPMALGDEHTCKLGMNGMECIGLNKDYQLGNDKSQGSYLAYPAVGTATLIGAGAAHTCAYSPEKGLTCWGSNTYSQTGSGGTGLVKFPSLVLWLKK